MKTLLERWADRGAPIHTLATQGYQNLLEQVTVLHNSGPDWRKDGCPQQVAQTLWKEIQEVM